MGPKVQPISTMPTSTKASTEVGVPFSRNCGMSSPKAMMATVTQMSQRRRPMRSATMPERLVKMPKTTAPIIRKPVKVLAGMPRPMGCPAGDITAGLLEKTCTKAVIT